MFSGGIQNWLTRSQLLTWAKNGVPLRTPFFHSNNRFDLYLLTTVY